MNILECKGVEFTYPKATERLSINHFAIHAGESVFLTGPSGSGKTTFLNLCAGVLLPQKGSIQLMGQAFHDLSEGQRDKLRVDHIGFIFQQFNLLPYLSVLDNVLLPVQCSARRRSRAVSQTPSQTESQTAPPAAGGTVNRAVNSAVNSAENRSVNHTVNHSINYSVTHSVNQSALACLAALGLADLAERKAAHLSVGQQQRVAVARALLGHPDLIIADEPSSALDDENQRQFMHLLLDQCQKTGAALMMVSHDMRLAEYFKRHEKVGQI